MQYEPAGQLLGSLTHRSINAVAESFFGTFKNELIYRRPWLTRRDARDAIVEYIEIFYNRIRRRSTIGYVSPGAFEEMDQATRACAA